MMTFQPKRGSVFVSETLKTSWRDENASLFICDDVGFFSFLINHTADCIGLFPKDANDVMALAGSHHFTSLFLERGSETGKTKQLPMHFKNQHRDKFN